MRDVGAMAQAALLWVTTIVGALLLAIERDPKKMLALLATADA